MMRKGSCVHFTGVMRGSCAIGISYIEVRKGGPVPCITLNGRRNDCCDKYQEPTAEQIAADEREIDLAMEKHRQAMVFVAKWKTWTKTNRVAKVEVVDCPVCKMGKLSLSQAAYNGHVWGKCSTPDCVSWMQ